MSDLNEISSKLWAMANELRGNMDAAEYKNYILAFMFYRYLSEHQEEYLVTNNVLDVEPGQTVNQAYLEQANNEELADYLEDISSRAMTAKTFSAQSMSTLSSSSQLQRARRAGSSIRLTR